MSDDAWANFIASIDPAQLESERMRVHGDLNSERPGSSEDLRMREAHYWLIQPTGKGATISDAEWLRRHAIQNADADRVINARSRNEARDAAIRSYSQRKAAEAAERRAA